MTVAQLTPRTPSPRRDGCLGDRLGSIHGACLRDLRAFVEATKAQDRDIWPRWNAIRYVDTVFSGRFDRERRAIDELRPVLRADDADRLWAGGELVAALRWQLRNAVGLCHHGAEFADLSGKLLRAVEGWCAAVEKITGPLSWDDLPPVAREEMTFLGADIAPAWRELPASLVTSL